MRTPVRTLRRSLTAIAGTLLLGAGSAHAAPPPTEVIGKPSLKGAGNVYGYPDGAVTARVCGQVAPVRNTDVLTCPPDWKLSDPSGTDTAGRELRLYAVPEPGWKHAGWENCPALTASRGCSLYAAQGTTERFARSRAVEKTVERQPSRGSSPDPPRRADRADHPRVGAADRRRRSAARPERARTGAVRATVRVRRPLDRGPSSCRPATDLDGLKSSLTRITVENRHREHHRARWTSAYVASRATKVVDKNGLQRRVQVRGSTPIHTPLAVVPMASGVRRCVCTDLADRPHTLAFTLAAAPTWSRSQRAVAGPSTLSHPEVSITARGSGFEAPLRRGLRG